MPTFYFFLLQPQLHLTSHRMLCTEHRMCVCFESASGVHWSISLGLCGLSLRLSQLSLALNSLASGFRIYPLIQLIVSTDTALLDHRRTITVTFAMNIATSRPSQ